MFEVLKFSRVWGFVFQYLRFRILNSGCGVCTAIGRI